MGFGRMGAGRGRTLVLCYHAVSERWPAPLSVRPDRLRAQLRLLLRAGYTGATFSEALLAPPAARTLAVTFDDAFRSVAELAFPILDELGLPATVFVPTEFARDARPLSWPGIDQWMGGPHAGELAALGWPELQRLARAGWEIGSHTCTHPRLTQLSDQDLEEQVTRSREACERGMQRPCRSLAYPYGDVDARVLDATRRAGYEVAAALPAGPQPESRHAWPRVGVYQRDALWRFALKVSPLGPRLRAVAHA